MAMIVFTNVHDIIVDNKKESGTVISIRDYRGSDVDLIFTKSDADFLATVLNEKLGKDREVKCIWDLCKYNKGGYCAKDRIELTNIVVGHPVAGELLDCKQFEMGDEKDDPEGT